MSKHLVGALTNPRTTPAEAQDPIRYLLQLQTDGAASLRGQNPVRLYLDTQAWRCSSSPRVTCAVAATLCSCNHAMHHGLVTGAVYSGSLCSRPCGQTLKSFILFQHHHVASGISVRRRRICSG